MCRINWVLLVLVAGTSLAVAEEPPYKRTLQGLDALRAAALQKQIDELCASAKFDEAVQPAEQLRDLRRRVQGEGHWEAADAARKVTTLRKAAALAAPQRQALAAAPRIVNQAVGASNGRSQYAEAEQLFRRALAAYEEALGPRHPDTATVYSNLAYVINAQGRYKEAEALSRKALAVREEVLGKRHPDTATSMNNLAMNLEDQGGRDREAEALHRQALAVREEVLGPRHPDTATSINNLAYNVEAQGRYTEAEALSRKALAVREEVLGKRHPDTATSYSNLAIKLDQQGRYREAEVLHRRALDIHKEALGPRDPRTAISTHNLAWNLHSQGWHREAEPLYRMALAVWQEVLGPRNPYTVTGQGNLARVIDAQGRHKEAEPLFRKTLALRQEVLGKRHPDTAGDYTNLAFNLDAQGRLKEAEPLYRRALTIREEALGARHPLTIDSYLNLGVNLDHQGRHKEAEPFCRKALTASEEVFGARDLRTAYGYNNLAVNLKALGRPQEAELLLRKALAIADGVLGKYHYATFVSEHNLARNLEAQGRYPEAEPLWQAAAERYEAMRLRVAASALDKAVAVPAQPHLGLAACRAHLGRARDAWEAAEGGLARGLLDDLAAGTGLPPGADRQDRDRAARLDALDRVLLPLLAAEKPDGAARRRRDDLLRQRAALEEEVARVAAERSRQAVLSLDAIQTQLTPGAALVFWVDVVGGPGAAEAGGGHWGCVVRRAGPPNWVRLPGSGPQGAWTEVDDRLPRLLHDDLARGESAAGRGRRLAAQRLEPLATHLAASADLPAVGRLVVVPAGRMAGIPVEALTDRYLVSYAPSGSVFARLCQKHRPLAEPTLLAVGDPTFTLPQAGPPPEPPDQGLYLSLVLPGGGAAKAGLRAGDVLLSYAGTRLATRADLKVAAEGGERVPVIVWRDGKTLDELRVAPGKLGVVVSEDPPTVALRKRRELDQLADARVRGDGLAPLPGTRLEVAALAGLLPEDRSTVLLGSQASEQELDALRAAGKLKQYRLLHLATHGTVDPGSARFSALELSRDRLPGPEEQARRAAAGKKVYTGRLSVATIADEWDLDADLVTLSACQTGLGPDGGGEGLLGFSQVLLGRGTRSLLLSLWKVDDTATALLMTRFYQNLLGKRDGLAQPLSKAEALREAKAWLRTLSRSAAQALAGRLAKGSVRATEEPEGPVVPAVVPALPSGDVPFAQPRYWAAFILIGDPE
jgi:tetratricopeptide (TPR) repeat protein